jgi:translation initiation factor IF-1
MQKSATPVPIARVVEEAGDHLNMAKPNAVVKEKSTQAEFDVNAQQVEAIQHLAGRIRKERVEVRTGNVMVDQFVPWYFSGAFGFYFHLPGRNDGHA